MKEDIPMDELIQALRADLPTLEDEQRVKAQLSRRGIFASYAANAKQEESRSLPKKAAGWAPMSLPTSFISKVASLGVTKGVLVVATAGIAFGSPVVSRVWRGGDEAPQEEGRSRPSETPKKAVVASRKSTTSPAPISTREDEAASLVDEKGPEKERAAERVVSPQPAGALAPKRPTSKKNDSGEPQAPGQVRGGPSQLERETNLIEAAIAAHRRGDEQRALSLLERHARDFAMGHLTVERQRLKRKWMKNK